MKKKMFNNNNNNNNQYKPKPMRKNNPPQNFSNFKPANFNNYNLVSNVKANESGFLNNPNNLTENYQNLFGRNAFSQNFWKSYAKSYDYDYFITTSDLLKSTTDFYNEINNIFEDNTKKRENLNVL